MGGCPGQEVAQASPLPHHPCAQCTQYLPLVPSVSSSWFAHVRTYASACVDSHQESVCVCVLPSICIYGHIDLSICIHHFLICVSPCLAEKVLNQCLLG